jgi:hypothetical protein
MIVESLASSIRFCSSVLHFHSTPTQPIPKIEESASRTVKSVMQDSGLERFSSAQLTVINQRQPEKDLVVTKIDSFNITQYHYSAFQRSRVSQVRKSRTQIGNREETSYKRREAFNNLDPGRSTRGIYSPWGQEDLRTAAEETGGKVPLITVETIPRTNNKPRTRRGSWERCLCISSSHEPILLPAS